MDQIPLKKQMGFIINTEPRKKGTGHWVACFIDTKNDMSVEYYDSFAGQPSKKFLKGLKVIIDKLNPSVYLKFKVNKIKEQKETSGDCGWHSISFLKNRFRGVPFQECTGFRNYKKGINDVKKVKKQYPSFDYI
jgi:Ulp1 family protease